MASNLNICSAKDRSINDKDIVIVEDNITSGSTVEPNNFDLLSDETTVEFADGDGSEENPYQIATAEQFNLISKYNNSYFILINDITSSVNTIKNFSGYFDGQNHSIYNQKGSVFNRVNGTICNLNVVNGSIYVDTIYTDRDFYHYDGIGGIVKILESGTIKNCNYNGNIKVVTTNNYASYFWQRIGGIVGYSIFGLVENCTTTGRINVKSVNFVDVGGIVGANVMGKINKCFSKMDIYSQSNYNYDGYTFTNAYSTVGGIVGDYSNGYIPTNCINASNVLYSSCNDRWASVSKTGIYFMDNHKNTFDKVEDKLINIYSWSDTVLYRNGSLSENGDDSIEKSLDELNDIWYKIKNDIPIDSSPDDENNTIIGFNQKQYEFELGKDYIHHLGVDLDYSTNDKSDITFTSSNTDVADISEFYMETNVFTKKTSVSCDLNLKSAGTTVITVTNSKGSSASCTVTVKEVKESLEIVSVDYDRNIMNSTAELNIEVKFNNELDLVGGNIEVYNGNDKIFDILDYNNEKSSDKTYAIDETDSKKLIITILNPIKNNYRQEKIDDTAGEDNENLLFHYNNTWLTCEPLTVYIDNNDVKAKRKEVTFEKTNFTIDLYDYYLNYPDDIFSYGNELNTFDAQHYELNDLFANRIHTKNPTTLYDLRYENDWGGSCFGMSTLVGLIKNGYLPLSNIKENTENVSQLPMPRDSKQIAGVNDWINYIQLLQYDERMTFKKKIYKVGISQMWKVFWKDHKFGGDTKEEYTQVLKEIVDKVKNMEKNKPSFTIGFGWIEEGELKSHSILPFYYYFDNIEMEHKIVCYNPSITKEESSRLYSIVSIDEGYTYFKVPHWTEAPVMVGYTDLAAIKDTFDFSPIEENKSRQGEQEAISEATNLILQSSSNFDIQSGDKKVLYRNGEFSGNPELIEDLNIISNGADSPAMLNFELKKGNSYNITTSEDTLDCIFTSPEVSGYANLSGTNISVCFDSLNKKVTSSGNNMAYDIALSFDDSKAVSVSSDNETNVTIENNNSNEMLINTENNNNVTVDFISDGKLQETQDLTVDDDSDIKIVKNNDKLEIETLSKTVTYEVKFNSNGGSSVENMTVISGNTVDLPKPTKDGYVFKGWFKESSLENEFKSTDKVESDLSLYAKWNKIVTLTFDSNGGSPVNSIDIEAGKTITLPIPTRSGYTFDGWYLDNLWSSEYTDTTEAPSHNETLYAKWTKNLQTLIGDVNKDGAITSKDAVLALQMSTGNKAVDLIADVNNDGYVTVKDAVLILRYSTGNITKF